MDIPNYENVTKGEGMGSLCFTGAAQITHCHTAAWQDQTQAETVTPFVKQERKPACTEAEELWQLASHCAKNTEHGSLSYETLSVQQSFLSTGYNPVIQAVKPARKGSSEILMPLYGRNQKHSLHCQVSRC